MLRGTGALHMSDISFGAVGAALIAAVVSVVGLILAKEQKVSEFRQAWIDALRHEISVYLSSVTDISNKLSVDYKDKQKKIESLAAPYQKLNEASFNIKLRLNPDEAESSNVIKAMDNIESAFDDDKDIVGESIQHLEKELLKKAKILLKKEWKRVKDGEATYQFAKWASFVLTSVLILCIIIMTLAPRGKPSKSVTENSTSSLGCAAHDGAFYESLIAFLL